MSTVVENERGQKAHFLMFVSHRAIDGLMRAADLYEPGRHVARPEEITADFKDDVELDLERAFQMFEDGGERASNEEFEVVYAMLLGIEVDGERIANDRVKPYIKPGLTSITDGHKFFMIRKLVESHGLVPTMGGWNNQEVVSVEFPERS
jgi:hypothetical protein